MRTTMTIDEDIAAQIKKKRVDSAISQTVQTSIASSSKQGAGSKKSTLPKTDLSLKSGHQWKQLRELVDQEEPIHVLELSKKLKLFETYPDTPVDVFALLAIDQPRRPTPTANALTSFSRASNFPPQVKSD